MGPPRTMPPETRTLCDGATGLIQRLLLAKTGQCSMAAQHQFFAPGWYCAALTPDGKNGVIYHAN